VTKEEARKYRDSLDIVSPKRLAEALPELSHKQVPVDLRGILGEKDPWEIMEDAVFGVFSMCFGYETRKLGHERRFQADPEGEVATSNDDPYALLYDCKSASDAFSMNKDDERAVIEYINTKKGEIQALFRCNLRYFLIVGPAFAGDLNLRRQEVNSKTGVALAFVKADALSYIALWALKIPPLYKKQIDLRQILKSGDEVVDQGVVKEYAKNFDAKFQKVYVS
jgi:hypothetical protein